MQIVINNCKFEYDLGCKILKLKYDTCPFPELSDIWDNIIPATFEEIALIENVEERRIGILYLGMDKIFENTNSILVSKQTLNKSTTWVNKDGILETKDYEDTYELYKIKGEDFYKSTIKTNTWWNEISDVYYLKFKDTSTEREYILWVNIDSIKNTNRGTEYSDENLAIKAIAWTIQTNVEIGNISEIIRQGDCILIKPIENAKFTDTPRHLTEKEYISLLKIES